MSGNFPMRTAVLIVLGLLASAAIASFFFARRMKESQVVELPVQMAAVPAEEPVLTIVVKGQGMLEVNGATMDSAALERLLLARKWDERAGVAVQMAAESAFTESVSVLNLCRRCGVVQLYVETSPREEPNGRGAPSR